MKSNRYILLILTAILAISCSDQNHGNWVIVLHPHENIEDKILSESTKIFLAGTIDRGNSIDWQAQVQDMFTARHGRYVLFNPRQQEWHPEKAGEMDYQVNWELEHLEKADWILMNFLPESKSPITLLELGLHARSGKLLVICPEKFYRYDNVRITCQNYNILMFNSIEDAIEKII